MQKPRILIVEDSKTSTISVGQVIEKRGWMAIGPLKSGEEAIQLVEKE
ncbi:MAG: hypothetical protein SVR08_10550 [Spirochaetota bacterium]|nr:hypothetical protein [Spirochaetota bacterium]